MLGMKVDSKELYKSAINKVYEQDSPDMEYKTQNKIREHCGYNPNKKKSQNNSFIHFENNSNSSRFLLCPDSNKSSKGKFSSIHPNMVRSFNNSQQNSYREYSNQNVKKSNQSVVLYAHELPLENSQDDLFYFTEDIPNQLEISDISDSRRTYRNKNEISIIKELDATKEITSKNLRYISKYTNDENVNKNLANAQQTKYCKNQNSVIIQNANRQILKEIPKHLIPMSKNRYTMKGAQEITKKVQKSHGPIKSQRKYFLRKIIFLENAQNV